eukprot:970611-Rhodomonas_salina.1
MAWQVAISDFRGSHPSGQQLADLASDAQVRRPRGQTSSPDFTPAVWASPISALREVTACERALRLADFWAGRLAWSTVTWGTTSR